MSTSFERKLAPIVPTTAALRDKRAAAHTVASVTHYSTFDLLPDSAYMREAQLVQSSKRPHVLAPLPFSAPTLWRKVKSGTFPAPVKLSARVTAWRVSDIRAWMKEQS